MKSKLHTESYLPDFFTWERLAEYRNLSSRFPFWCGHWPEKVADLPERERWWPDARFVPVMKRWDPLPGHEFLGVFFGEDEKEELLVPTEDMILAPEASFEGETEWPRFVSDFDPPIYGALLAAIFYISTDFDTERRRRYSLRRADIWAEGFREFMAGDHPRQLSRADAFLAQRNRVMMASGTEREKEYFKLESAWVRLGEKLGVLPKSQRGGPAVSLPRHFLQQLLSEAEALVAEVSQWSPGAAELESVADLLGIHSADLDDYHREFIFWIERREGPDAAEEKRREILNRGGEQADLRKWALHLGFPLLDRKEVELLEERNRDPRTRRHPGTTARRLLELRLGVRDRYLNDHLR